MAKIVWLAGYFESIYGFGCILLSEYLMHIFLILLLSHSKVIKLINIIFSMKNAPNFYKMICYCYDIVTQTNTQ